MTDISYTEQSIHERYLARLAAILEKHGITREQIGSSKAVLADLKEAQEELRQDWVMHNDLRDGRKTKLPGRRAGEEVETVVTENEIPDNAPLVITAAEPAAPPVVKPGCSATHDRADAEPVRCRVKGSDHTEHRWWNKNGDVISWASGYDALDNEEAT